MYISKGPLLDFIVYLKKVFNFLNKHFYIVLIISWITKYKNNKFYKSILWLIRIFVIVNIIFSVGYIIYISYIEHSIFTGFSIYYDLMNYYYNNFFNFCNDLINLDNEDSIINHIKNIKDSDTKLKNEIKSEVKEAFKEVMDEAIDKLDNMEVENNSNYLKNIALFSSVLFLSYFIFILPGSGITPQELLNYNWNNQSLIELKINIINLFNNPTNPGTPDNKGIDLPSPNSTNSSQLSNYFPNNDQSISPVISNSSIEQSTITPNTPVIKYSNLPHIESSTQTIINSVDSSSQTTIDGITVSKLVESNNIIQDVLDPESKTTILNHTNNIIKNITD